MNFKENQIVKFVPYADGSNETPLRVKKVWKDGGITTTYLNGHQHGKYKATGYTRARGDYGGYGRVVPLADGETLESVFAANTARDEAKKLEQAAKASEASAAMNKWFAEVGDTWWAGRQIIEGFKVPSENGHNELSVVRYRERGEERIAFVNIVVSKEWDDKIRYELSIGGLVNRGEYTGSYCTSTTKAPTLDECVYQAFSSIVL